MKVQLHNQYNPLILTVINDLNHFLTTFKLKISNTNKVNHNHLIKPKN